MAKVTKRKDGLAHLLSSPITTLDTLCGICDDPDNKPVGDEYEGEITCTACKQTAWVVLNSFKKSEVK